MDVWEEQIKSPNPMTAPSAMLSKLKSLPGVPAGTWPNADYAIADCLKTNERRLSSACRRVVEAGSR